MAAPAPIAISMGHQRLGSPPASRYLPEIVSLLIAGDTPEAELVDGVAKETDALLLRAVKDPAFVEALWLLARIPQAAKADNFSEALRVIGVKVPDTPSATDIVVGFDAAIEAAQRGRGADITDLGEMARQAGIAALCSLSQERLPALWEPTREDVRTTIATFTAPDKFGELAHRFFANLAERGIQYFLDRAIPRHIGPDKLVHSVGDMAFFDGAVRRHCAESAMIMRAFAKDWLGKNVFNEGKVISRRDIAGFAAHASEKIRKELSIRSMAGENI